MTGRVPEQAGQAGRPAPERLELLSFVVRSIAPSEMRMSRRGSWVPLDFGEVLQRLEQPAAQVRSA